MRVVSGCEVVAGNSHLPGSRYSHYHPAMKNTAGAIAPVIAIDRHSDRPLPRQVYDGFARQSCGGELRPGQRVPSSRQLSAELMISRFPLLDAYAQLLAEGYFETRSGCGTFVSASLPNRSPNSSLETKHPDARPPGAVCLASRSRLSRLSKTYLGVTAGERSEFTNGAGSISIRNMVEAGRPP